MNAESVGSDDQQQQQQCKRLLSCTDINFTKLTAVARKGLPSLYRPQIWKTIMGYYPTHPSSWEAIDADCEKSYSDMLHFVCAFDDEEKTILKPSSALQEAIDRDIPRTMPTLRFYTGGEDAGDDDSRHHPSPISAPHRAVQRIMYTTVAVNRGIRYFQGMNDIAAQLLYAFCQGDPGRLCLSTEAATFHCFQTMLVYLSEGSSGDVDFEARASDSIQQFELLLQFRDAELFQHLQQQSVAPELYAMRWFLLLFLREFREDASLRLWDFFLSFGDQFRSTAIVFGVALCVSEREAILANTNLTDIIPYLASPTAPLEAVIQRTMAWLVQTGFGILEELARVPKTEWPALRRKYNIAPAAPGLREKFTGWLQGFALPQF